METMIGTPDEVLSRTMRTAFEVGFDDKTPEPPGPDASPAEREAWAQLKLALPHLKPRTEKGFVGPLLAQLHPEDDPEAVAPATPVSAAASAQRPAAESAPVTISTPKPAPALATPPEFLSAAASAGTASEEDSTQAELRRIKEQLARQQEESERLRQSVQRLTSLLESGQARPGDGLLAGSTSAFVRPTREEVWDFFRENTIQANPDTFFNYYEARGWMIHDTVQ